ncbi:MAG: helix-turn-helix transcriptional regulator [Paludibacteraceae bacterium]|nr:helix-turn-helix transcriptional regulator [Paludibacteraceae bacterium]
MTGTLTGSLTGTRKNIVEIISGNANVTISQIATQLGKSPRGIDKHLQKLRELGIIRRVGGDFGGHWEIIEK